MKRVVFLLFLAAVLATAVNAQRYGNTTCGLVPGPCVERAIRQGYAPMDFMLNNFGYGYGYGGLGYGYGYYGSGRSAIVGGIAGAATGALTGYLTARAVSHRDDREYVRTPDGGQAYYAPNYTSAPQGREVRWPTPKPAKRLDCSKPPGKRGKNETACAAAEQQACLADLATSPWRLRNFSPVATIYPTVNNQPLFVCREQVVLGPLQTVYISPPEGLVGGYFFFAHSSGEKMRAEAEVQAVNRPGFTGFILTVPGPPKRGN